MRFTRMLLFKNISKRITLETLMLKKRFFIHPCPPLRCLSHRGGWGRIDLSFTQRWDAIVESVAAWHIQKESHPTLDAPGTSRYSSMCSPEMSLTFHCWGWGVVKSPEEWNPTLDSQEACTTFYLCATPEISLIWIRYGLATISRLPKNIGLFYKRALYKRQYSAKETHNSKSLLIVATLYH